MGHLIWVGLGGGLGAVCRYLMSGWVASWWGREFPLGTFLVNLLGSFLIGILFVVLVERLGVSTSVRGLLMAGFLGGFSTFSSFALEAHQLLAQGNWSLAVWYALASVILCLLAVALGMWAARLI